MSSTQVSIRLWPQPPSFAASSPVPDTDTPIPMLGVRANLHQHTHCHFSNLCPVLHSSPNFHPFFLNTSSKHELKSHLPDKVCPLKPKALPPVFTSCIRLPYRLHSSFSRNQSPVWSRVGALYVWCVNKRCHCSYKRKQIFSLSLPWSVLMATKSPLRASLSTVSWLGLPSWPSSSSPARPWNSKRTFSSCGSLFFAWVQLPECQATPPLNKTATCHQAWENTGREHPILHCTPESYEASPVPLSTSFFNCSLSILSLFFVLACMIAFITLYHLGYTGLTNTITRWALLSLHLKLELADTRKSYKSLTHAVPSYRVWQSEDSGKTGCTGSCLSDDLQRGFLRCLHHTICRELGVHTVWGI